MKVLIFMISAILANVAFAQTPIKIENRIHSVEIEKSETGQYLVVGAEICFGGYPTVDASTTKLGTNAVAITLSVFARTCAPGKTFIAKFVVLIEDQIVDLGLDPKATNIFVQVR